MMKAIRELLFPHKIPWWVWLPSRSCETNSWLLTSSQALTPEQHVAHGMDYIIRNYREEQRP